MTITYTNRSLQTYYLHQGTTKTGKPKYFFSKKYEGNLVEQIPDGFEIYENPNAQVFLRRIPKKIVTDAEVQVVKQGMENFAKVKPFIIDVKKEIIYIFISSNNTDQLSEMIRATAGPFTRDADTIEQLIQQSIRYTSDLRFTLIDKQTRRFQTERYCYLGRIDDWIHIGHEDSLDVLVKTYLPHLGQESFFELH
ncbi:hypothetical protein [Adonisia turfae]|uniref:Uncharacterized protein n=1 Tax=Adonisia turfae CCMR0081 TaxID=2292702 RepID=A0A6M0RE35_9CYAN|nr:hypothetical protein [Adonisia turfae]NEZ54163.1 hypothetical protein [Adonisia turfae CCMR0081]